MAYKVVEVFESIQGEGLQSGRLATFLRFAGCNLRCPWCDTPESFEVDKKTNFKLDNLVDLVNEKSTGRYVILTGGEPTLQDLQPLIHRLQALGFEVGMETNGTLPVPETVDWLTVSPKPPVYKIHPTAADMIKELKLVVDDNLNIQTVTRLWQEIGEEVPVILQPESGRPDMITKIMKWLKLEPRWRLGIQLHKLIGVK